MHMVCSYVELSRAPAPPTVSLCIVIYINLKNDLKTVEKTCRARTLASALQLDQISTARINGANSLSVKSEKSVLAWIRMARSGVVVNPLRQTYDKTTLWTVNVSIMSTKSVKPVRLVRHNTQRFDPFYQLHKVWCCSGVLGLTYPPHPPTWVRFLYQISLCIHTSQGIVVCAAVYAEKQNKWGNE